MEETHDVIIGMHVLEAVRCQIGNRQGQRAKLWEQIVALDGEIAGLREAQHQIEKAKGYNVALPKLE